MQATHAYSILYQMVVVCVEVTIVQITGLCAYGNLLPD